MPKKKNFNTSAILKEVYPIIEDSLKKNLISWKRCLSNFISKRSQYLFDTVPADRIYYRDEDKQELFKALKITEAQIKAGIGNTYYANHAHFKPASAKDSVTIVALCIVRYFCLKKDKTNLELAMIYLAFSAKFYPIIHYEFFKVVAPSKYRYIMEYVVNHMLSQKFDLKSKGSVIGAIKSINSTWITSYEKMFKSFDDEDTVYVNEQLFNRIKSFMKNIASLYYEAYKNKDGILYEKDQLPDEGSGDSTFNLSTNDSFKLQQYVENTMNTLNTTKIDYKTCTMCVDGNIGVQELSALMETILNNPENLDKIKELITLYIATYLVQANNKDIATVAFLKFTIQPKPNTKDPSLNRIKDIMEELLDDNSVQYRKRKHRIATKLSYHKAIAKYFAFTIINSNK